MTDYQQQMAENHRNSKGKIGWAKKTCNIVVGCSGKGCECRDICVAKEQFNRWHLNADGTVNMWPKNQSFRNVQFYPERLKMLNEHRGSGNAYFYFPIMGDPFDDNSPLVGRMPIDWAMINRLLGKRDERAIEYLLSFTEQCWLRILNVLIDNPQSHLVLLTKQPQNIPADLPKIKNLWVGISTSGADSCRERERIFMDFDYPRKVVSWEPVQGTMSGRLCDSINWLIIGGNSRGKHNFADHAGRVWYYVAWCIKTTDVSIFTKLNLYQDRNGKRWPGWEDFEPVCQWPETPK